MIGRILTALAFFIGASCAPLASDEAPPLNAQVYSDHHAVKPGQTFAVLLEVKLAPNWHLYWKNPGDIGVAPTLTWQLPQGLSVKSVAWAAPERFQTGDLVTFGYVDEAHLLVELETTEALEPGEITLPGSLQWIACSADTCLPGETSLNMVIHVGHQDEKNSEASLRFAEAHAALPEKVSQATVRQKEGKVFVTLPKNLLAAESYAPIYFFPEEMDGVDNHQTFSRLPGANDDEDIIALNTTDEKLTKLKGLLVVGEKAFQLDAPIESHAASAHVSSVTEEETLSFLWAVVFALAGGLLLNLMPCVLPVVSLKLMSLIRLSGQSRSIMSKHGIAFTFGVLVSFWLLAAALLLFQFMGQAVGWGFQLQNPLFIALLTLLFLMLGLNLFGVFELGTTVAAYAGGVTSGNRQESYKGSFLSGVFATAVATPCTGPFMGSALGYALGQPSYVAFAIFSALAIGMSLPYLLIGFFPSLIRWMPKPGAWMESFKQAMGFLMLATVIWFLWIFVGQTAETSLFLLLFAMLIVSFGAWVYGRWGTPAKGKSVRRLSYAIAASCLFAGVFISYIATSSPSSSPQVASVQHAGWEPFSPERLAELRKNGTPVLIDFTAKWCLICQANHLVLTHSEVEKKFQEQGVVRMKADWTKYDPVITEELRKHGRSGVPLYVLYGEEEKPQILPQILTPEALISSIEAVKPSNVH